MKEIEEYSWSMSEPEQKDDTELTMETNGKKPKRTKEGKDAYII